MRGDGGYRNEAALLEQIQRLERENSELRRDCEDLRKRLRTPEEDESNRSAVIARMLEERKELLLEKARLGTGQRDRKDALRDENVDISQAFVEAHLPEILAQLQAMKHVHAEAVLQLRRELRILSEDSDLLQLIRRIQEENEALRKSRNRPQR